MKKWTTIFIFITCICLLSFALCNCSKTPNHIEPEDTGKTSESDDITTNPQTVSVCFWDGDICINKIEVEKGTLLSEAKTKFPTIPDKKGYNSLEWKCEKENVESIVDELNFYAQYEAKTYTIKFDCSNSNNTNIVETTVTYDCIIDDYQELYDDNLMFVGWKYGEHIIQRDTLWEIDCDNIILTPIWENYPYELLYQVRNDGKIIITGATGNLSNLIIPSKYKNYEVYGVADEAFKGNDTIRSVTLYDGVVEIGAASFEQCEKLSNIFLGKGIKTIGENAFSGIDRNETGICWISMFSNVEKIEKGAFRHSVSFWTKGRFNLYGNINDYATIEFGDEDSNPFVNRNLYLNGKSVTEINIDEADYISSLAFINCSNISKYIIGTSVKSIGKFALHMDFYAQSSIYYEGSIDNWCRLNLGEAWFSGTMHEETSDGDFPLNISYPLYCKGELVEVVLFPEDITSVQDYQFYGCKSIKEVILHDNVNYIGKGAFAYSSISAINIPDKVEEIGTYAFISCEELNYSATYGSLHYIGNETNPYIAVISSNQNAGEYIGFHPNTKFILSRSMKDSGAKDAIIPNSVKDIEYFAFWDCVSLNSVILPDNLLEIGAAAFHGCENLESIIIPSTVTKIGGYAFYDCRKLNNIRLSEGLLEIGELAFGYCELLTEVVIPTSVRQIGEGIFYGCENLQKVVLPFVGEKLINDTSHYYIPHDGASGRIINTTHTIEHLFVNPNIIGENFIPEKLEDVTICAGTLSEYAFWNDNIPIKKLTLLDGVTSIEKGSLSGCEKLETLNLSFNNELSEMEDTLYNLFDGFPQNLKTVIITDGTVIPQGFFKDTGIENVVLPNGITSIGDDAFSSCHRLTGLIIPEGVTSIGNYAFWYCSSLTSITIPDSVTSIGDYAFNYCSSLTSINIPEGVTSIGGDAFYNCSSLTSITIPDSVTNIGKYAFYGCSDLTSITFQGTMEQWNTISKGNNWNYNTGNYTIYCEDGNISKS